MSDTDTDPITSHLLQRKAELEGVLTNTHGRLQEIDLLLMQLADGRTRVRRRLREVPAPPDSQPETAA